MNNEQLQSESGDEGVMVIGEDPHNPLDPSWRKPNLAASTYTAPLVTRDWSEEWKIYKNGNHRLLGFRDNQTGEYQKDDGLIRSMHVAYLNLVVGNLVKGILKHGENSPLGIALGTALLVSRVVDAVIRVVD